MNADLLREAASLMRTRAEAATPGPWSALTTGVRGGDHWYICDAGESIALIAANDGVNDAQRQPDAEHIASWHPAVALAVADLLNASADRMDNRPAFSLTPVGATAAHVARVFLGRES